MPSFIEIGPPVPEKKIFALPYTEYPLRILKFEIRAEITEYDANGRGRACTKSVKNAYGSLQMSN